jgi:hypothetical protein
LYVCANERLSYRLAFDKRYDSSNAHQHPTLTGQVSEECIVLAAVPPPISWNRSADRVLAKLSRLL